jgi:hypothetical protein
MFSFLQLSFIDQTSRWHLRGWSSPGVKSHTWRFCQKAIAKNVHLCSDLKGSSGSGVGGTEQYGPFSDGETLHHELMADTGENRQISARANAHEAETVREAKKMISEERSTAKTTAATFGGTEKGFKRYEKKGKQRSSDPKAAKLLPSDSGATRL